MVFFLFLESTRNKTRQLHDDFVKSAEEGDVRSIIEALPNLTSTNYDAVLNGATLDRKCVLYLYVCSVLYLYLSVLSYHIVE